jgi:hypothetical protein
VTTVKKGCAAQSNSIQPHTPRRGTGEFSVAINPSD